MNELAQAVAKNILKEDPEIDDRINRGIETHRKGYAKIKLIYPDGQEVDKAEVSYKQKSHEYRFGGNAFMVNEFKQSDKNERYETIFADLFNLAVVPFFWSDLEPNEGILRFDSASQSIYRRPPIDTVLAFCKRHDITPKGHPLCWHHMLPKWAPTNLDKLEARLERRIREIAERYADQIQIWDVVNEALQWDPLSHAQLPRHHVEKAFLIAQKYFPHSAELLINDGPWVSWDSYHGDYTPLYMLVKSLLDRQLPVKGVGLQYHMAFKKPADMTDWADRYLNPRYLLANLDQYAKLGIPVNVSEVTVTAHHDFGNGDEFQKRVAEKLYRLWFSHPATNGIIYWNLVDDTAFVWPGQEDNLMNENHFRGGLLNLDLTPKPAFEIIHHLIKNEWMSKGSCTYESHANCSFHGFYGDYSLTVKTPRGEFNHILRHAKCINRTHHLKLTSI